MSTPPPIAEHLLEYRKVLVAADQKGQEEFDKAVLSLSGGGLGVSLVFLKDVIGTSQIEVPLVLMGAWVAWGLSTLAVLVSYHLSVLTIRRGIQQLDQGNAYSGPFGGKFAWWTETLNALGAALFFVGVLCITIFACINLSSKGLSNGNQNAGAASTAAGSSSTPTAGATTARTAGAPTVAGSGSGNVRTGKQ